MLSAPCILKSWHIFRPGLSSCLDRLYQERAQLWVSMRHREVVDVHNVPVSCRSTAVSPFVCAYWCQEPSCWGAPDVLCWMRSKPNRVSLSCWRKASAAASTSAAGGA